MKISLLLLCYNEAETIADEIKSWAVTLSKLPLEFESEILVVEDGSTDGTTEILDNLQSQGIMRHLHEEKRSGYNKALHRGLESCSGDYIFFSDTGLKNDLNDFWGIFYRRDLADLILGRKVLRSDQLYRRFLTKSLNLYLRKTLKPKFDLHDVDSGFRMFNRDFKEYLLKTGFNFKGFAGCEMVLLAWKSNYKVIEVPISYSGRDGESRGIPTSKIIGMILQLLSDIKKLVRH
jgi:glycosyltransferase involved in cell wall biosynthesis